MSELCNCGSEKPFQECCEPIIKGIKNADTAEELMRSRYVAFTQANVDYLMKSHHPATRPNKDRKKIKRWAQSVEWLYLSVMKVIDGGENDEKGTVIFRAFYIQNEEYDNIYEESFFEKKDGKWMYVDGVDLNMENEEKLFSGN
jgi:SEC-C motif-containing protein